MGIILAEKNFIPSGSSRDLLENSCSDTELQVGYKLKAGTKIECPYCHRDMAHCGIYEKKLLNLLGKTITVKLPRLKCSNPECPAVKKNRCERSTHVVYPNSIIPYIRYHVPEIILLFAIRLKHLNNWLGQILHQLKKSPTPVLYDAAEYFSRYHSELIREWEKFFYVRAKKSYLHISLNFHDVFKRGRLFARFWIMRHYRCKQGALRLKIAGTYFTQTIAAELHKIHSGTGPPRI
jgi:hypothetical protein